MGRQVWRWMGIAAMGLLGACGDSAGRGGGPASEPVDLTVLELRVRARESEIAGIKERVRADTRHNTTHIEIDLSDLNERLTAVRVRLDALKASSPAPTETSVREFDQAYDELRGAVREFKSRYGLGEKT